MQNLHHKFGMDHPDIKLSLSVFCLTRPKCIHLIKYTARRQCLCQSHANVALMVDAASVHPKSTALLVQLKDTGKTRRHVICTEVRYTNWHRTDVMQREPVKERERGGKIWKRIHRKRSCRTGKKGKWMIILVKFMPLKSKDPKYYVGKIIEQETDDEDDELIVSFYRQSRKMPGKCVTPIVKDIAPINKVYDFVMFLPQPESVGGNKRVAACLHFDVQLNKYNCH